MLNNIKYKYRIYNYNSRNRNYYHRIEPNKKKTRVLQKLQRTTKAIEVANNELSRI